MKKGFTLIEVLGALIVLGAISAIVFVIVGNIINTSRDSIYKKNESLLVEKARSYALSSDFVFPLNLGDYNIIELSTLKQNGMIDKMVDPKDSSILCDGKVYVYKAVSTTYEYIPYLECGTNYKTSNANYLDNNVSSISHTTVGNNHTITINLNSNNRVGYVYAQNRNIHMYKPTSLNYTQWNLNTSGTQGSFSINGSVSENTIILKENPWGRQDIVWANLGNDLASDADGGWNVTNLAINHTQTYRLSVWIRREDAFSSTTPSVVTGRTYFGTQANTVYNLGTTTLNNNPYFRNNIISELPSMVDNWLLWVAHIHPSSYSGFSIANSGVFKTDGTRLIGMTDYKWALNQTVGGHRVYLFYSTSVNEKQFYYRPRMEIVNANTPSINDLLNGYENPDIYGNGEINTTNTITINVSGTGIFPITLKNTDGTVKIIPYVIN